MSQRRPSSVRPTRRLRTDGGTEFPNDSGPTPGSADEYRLLLESYEPVGRVEVAEALLSDLERGGLDGNAVERLREALGVPDPDAVERLDRLEAEVSRLRETVDLLARRQRALLALRRQRER
ncbi:hypothetical protein [Natronorarus salvus]|uniref:hypothetical protein n=1 Tax=Natronorarus salvus TaxID=3117733 RepID=UPI002F26DF1C